MFNTVLVKKCLFALVLATLLVSLVQSSFELIEEQELHGSFDSSPKPSYSHSNWFTGDFQIREEPYLNENFGFRNAYVRLFNQMQFWLYNVSDTKDVVVGKKNVLYEVGHIRAYLGTDFLGQELITRKMEKLELISDTLAKLGTDLIFLVAPSKGSYLPEFIPEGMMMSEQGLTNYEVIRSALESRSVHFFDVRKWLLNGRDSTTFPVYSKTGIHLNRLTDLTIADSLLRYLESSRNLHLPVVEISNLVLSDSMRYVDDDIEKSMNLLLDVTDYPMPYVDFAFVQDSSHHRPKVLTIGDSYYWELFMMQFSTQVFDNGEFWYYLNDIYPRRQNGSSSLYDYDVATELVKNDVVILWVTELNLFGMGFIERAYDAFYDKEKSDYELQVRKKTLAIERNPDWFQLIISNAKRDEITTEKALRQMAEYAVSIEQ